MSAKGGKGMKNIQILNFILHTEGHMNMHDCVLKVYMFAGTAEPNCKEIIYICAK